MAHWGELKCPNCEDTFQMYVDANEARIDAEAKLSKCEALLAKAVEALQAAADDLSGYVGYSYADEYRTTLAAVSETHKLNKERSDEKGQGDE